MRNNPPPAVVKHGINQVRTNLKPGDTVDINAHAFACVFREELSDFMRNIEQHRRNAKQ